MKLPFILGTAQFGSHYGITNTEGRPTFSMIEDILQFSLENGINIWDSAYGYGEALDIVVNYSKKQQKKVAIINKFSVLQNKKDLAEKIENTLAISNIDSFYALLIHDPDNLNKISIKELNEFIELLKKKQYVEKVGVSLYSPDQLKYVINFLPIDVIQCPINLFDQRFLTEEMLSIYSQHHIELHARSLFLQGVLLNKQLPAKLSGLEPAWKKYQGFLQELQITALQGCLAWIKNIPHVDKWVIGVNKTIELKEIIDQYLFCDESFIGNANHLAIHDNSLIEPRNWVGI
jgi:aryl-alcohol dehydrogenase-like predicted oxidoreductase